MTIVINQYRRSGKAGAMITVAWGLSARTVSDLAQVFVQYSTYIAQHLIRA